MKRLQGKLKQVQLPFVSDMPLLTILTDVPCAAGTTSVLLGAADDGRAS